MRNLRLLPLALMALLFVAGQAWAFHDGGVAECNRCHTMHNSQDGAQVADTPEGNEYLLISGNASDTCLSCHASYGQFRNGEGHGPGGDFYWLTQTYIWESHGLKISTGDSHGHNIISPANGLEEDATLTSAPGGDFLSSRLGCTSCHDPHGRDTFRILYDNQDPGPIYDGTRYPFDYDAPEAKGNSRRTYVGSGGEETNTRHTIYKNGMAEWCANCHNDFLTANSTFHIHKTGQQLGGAVAGHYNAYVNTEDYSGTSDDSYWGIVPFEAVNVDLETADPTNYTEGPTGVDEVSCITCHRAHASAFPDIGRWMFGATFIVDDSHPAAGDSTAAGDILLPDDTDVVNKYYQYTFIDSQRNLCNKCHYKDQYDHIP